MTKVGTAYLEIEGDFSKINRQIAEHARAIPDAKQKVLVEFDESKTQRLGTALRGVEQRASAVGRSAEGAQHSISNLGNAFVSLYSHAAKISAIGIGAQGISAIGAAAVTTTASLAPLAGTLAAFPALASAGGQAAGTWKLAFSGVSTAVGGLNQRLDTSSKAFRELTPEGQRFAKQLEKMKQPLRDLSQTAQKGLLPGIEKGLTQGMRNFPVLQRGIGQTSKVLGGLVTQAGRLVGSKAFGADLNTQMRRNDTTIRRLGQSALYLSDAAVQVTLAAGPLVEWLTRSSESLAKQVDEWAKAGRASGDFARFLEQTRITISRVSRIASDLGHALFNIFSLAYPVGSDFLKLQVRLADNFRKWTESTQGQNGIRQFFEDARPAMVEAERLIGTVIKAFGNLASGGQVAPLLRTINDQLVPAFATLVDSTTKSFSPAFIHAVTQALLIFSKLGGSSGPLVLTATALGDVLGVLNTLLEKFPFLGQAIVTLAAVGSISKALGLTQALGDVERLIGRVGVLSGAKGGIFSKFSRLTAMPVYVVNGGVPMVGGAAASAEGTAIGAAEGASAGAVLTASRTSKIVANVKSMGALAAKVVPALAALDFATKTIQGGGALRNAVNTVSDFTFGLVPSVAPRGGNSLPKNQQDAVRGFLDQFKRFSGIGGSVKELENLRKLLSLSKNDVGDAYLTLKAQVDSLVVSQKRWDSAVSISSDHFEGFDARIKRNAPTWDHYAGVLANAKDRLHRLTVGSDAYNQQAERVASIQERINQRLLNVTHVEPEVKDAVSKLGINFSGLGGTVTDTAVLIEQAVNGVLHGLGAKEIKLTVHNTAAYKRGGGDLGGTGHLQAGGHIPGARTGDRVPAMLEEGEYVLNRQAVRALGPRLLDQINFGAAPRFQRGGGVGLQPAVASLASRLDKMFGLTTTSGYRTSQPLGHPDLHNVGLAADVSGAPGAMARAVEWIKKSGVASSLLEGIHNPGLSIKDGASVSPGFWGAATWAAHANHIHVALRALAAVAASISPLQVTGPAGPLLSAAQGASLLMEGAANAYIEQQAASTGGGDAADVGRAPVAGALSRAQIKSLWIKAGGSAGTANLATAIALAESSGRASARSANPAGGENRGLWQIWSGNPGSTFDALGSARAAVSLSAGGKDWSKWETYVTGAYRRFLQRGGLVKRVGAGLRLSAPPAEKVGLSAGKAAAIVAALSSAGFDRESDRLDGLRLAADTAADLAARAETLTDTQAIQDALNAELSKRGGKISSFPADAQQAIVDSMLPVVSGKTQLGWLSEEAQDLLTYRNSLVADMPTVSSMIDQVQKELARAAAEKSAITAAIAAIEAQIVKEEKEREKVKAAEEKALSAYKAERDKRHPDIEKVNQRYYDWQVLRGDVTDHTRLSQLGFAHSHKEYNARLSVMHADNSARGTQVQTIDDAISRGNDRIQSLTEAGKGLESALVDVQGLGSTRDILGALPPIGTLGGAILQVQKQISDLATNPPRVTADSVDTTATDQAVQDNTALADALRTQLNLANLRAQVSEAQYDQFRRYLNVPFGGSFKDGGEVPGPIGAPRMIMAHGGETVVPVGSQRTGDVHLHFSPGTEWLSKFVRVEVQAATRDQARRGSRILPGRGGS